MKPCPGKTWIITLDRDGPFGQKAPECQLHGPLCVAWGQTEALVVLWLHATGQDVETQNPATPGNTPTTD